MREGAAASAIDVLNETAMHRGEPDRLWGSHRGGIVVGGIGVGLWAVPRTGIGRASLGLAGAAGCEEGFAVHLPASLLSEENVEETAARMLKRLARGG